MKRYPLLYSYTHRGDFLVFHPHAGVFVVPTRRDSVFRQGLSNTTLYICHKLMQVALASSQIENEIHNQLSRSVVSHIATAFNRNRLAIKVLEMLDMTILPNSNYRGMFHCDNRVTSEPLGPQFH